MSLLFLSQPNIMLILSAAFTLAFASLSVHFAEMVIGLLSTHEVCVNCQFMLFSFSGTEAHHR